MKVRLTPYDSGVSFAADLYHVMFGSGLEAVTVH